MKSIRLILIVPAVLAGCTAGGPQREETSKVPTMTALPKDIYPESRSRLPLPKREALDEQGKRVYDSVLDPKRPTLAGFQGHCFPNQLLDPFPTLRVHACVSPVMARSSPARAGKPAALGP